MTPRPAIYPPPPHPQAVWLPCLEDGTRYLSPHAPLSNPPQAVWLPCLEDNILPHERSVAEAAGAGETLGLGMG